MLGLQKRCFDRVSIQGCCNGKNQCYFYFPQDYTLFHQAIAVPIHAIIANETHESKDEIWDAVTAEITRRYGNNSTGSVSIDNRPICVMGTK